jgi:predicted permease
LLGICAANVAQLIFARTATRATEITVRTALGASRGRIVAQLVAEALVLVSIAGVAGLVGAATGLRRLREMWETTSNQSLPFWWSERLSAETVAYSILLVILAALLIGGVPALKATGSQMNARLKDAGATGATMRFGKLWTGVMVAQVAVTVAFLLVLVSSGWTAYSQNQRAAQVAFPRNEYFRASIRLEDGVSAERQKTVRQELQRRLNDDPGVLNAAFAAYLPGENEGDEFWLEFPSPTRERGDAVKVQSTPAGSNYFETFQQPLLAGRLFTATEIEEGRNVAIVDETFVRLVLGGRSAIGQLVRQARTKQADEPGPWLEIVGVVKDITLRRDKTTADAKLYRPAEPDGDSIYMHSRSNDAAARLRVAVTATDPRLRLSKVIRIDRHAENDARMAGFAIKALGTIAAVTLMLAAAGIYSLISFTLASRTREIGIRTALGAAPLLIVRGMLSPAFVKVGIGIVLGSLPGTALIYTMLDRGTDHRMTALTTAGVTLFIILVAIISSISPVRRALRIQPTEALRNS